MTERLWAGWRSGYLDGNDEAGAARATGAHPTPAGDDLTIFERVLASGRPDEETLIVWRGERCFALLNLYPYTSGHVLVLPNHGARELEDLDEATATELWLGVRSAVAAVKAAYRPDGVNVGANLGRAAGAGVPSHLHVHVLPRWFGDTNFTTTVADTRVLPEPLGVTHRKILAAWPRPPA